MRKLHFFSVMTLSFAAALSACQKAEEAPPAPAPTVTMSVNPAVVTVGQGTNLTWTSTNATSCTASGSWNGTQAVSGSQSVNPTNPGTDSYTLICTGPSGNAAASASLVVNAPPPVAHSSSHSHSSGEHASSCVDCGKITAITPVKQAGEASGMGAVAGAVLGAVIGHQFGSGRGNSAATAGGAVAGGVGGYEAEKAIRSKTVYEVAVAMDSGGTRRVTLATQEGLAVGMHVRVEGNDIEPLNN